MPYGPGIYAIFLESTDNLPSVWQELLKKHGDFCKNKIFYIGESGGLRQRLRTYFEGSSRSHTCRLSIGAILHANRLLDLKPIKKNDSGKYSFEGEQKLSSWIQENVTLTFKQLPMKEVVCAKKKLICKFRPPMNLDDNPDSIPALRAVRSECRKLAQ